jgi:hypothetical protein
MTGAAAGAVLAASGFAVAACGSGGTSGNRATADNSAPGRVVSAAYTKTTEARTAKTTLSTQIGMGQQRLPLTGNGVIDFGAKTADLTETLPGNAGTSESRFVNGIVYQRLPAGAMTQLAGGKPWISIDANKVAQQQYGTSLSELGGGLSDPSDTLGYLRGAGDQVREIGPDTVDGAPTKHYDVTLDLDKASAGQSPQGRQATQKLEQQLGTHTLPAQVWVDDQGRLRKMTFSETIPNPGAGQQQNGPISIAVTETLSDFGTPVTVTAPPADQTADLTDKIAAAGH